MGRPCQLLLCIAMVAFTAIAQGRPINTSDNRKADFDYFYLVRQWPATFCNEHTCTHRPPRRYAFTVHGLWPERNDHTWPEYCDPGSELDEDAIEDLLPEMEDAWPSWSSDDATFWNHEWMRHGTCAERVVGGQHAFFSAVLKLHKKLNIQDALQSAGIVPSNTHQYPVQQLKDAMEAAYGVMPHITCDQRGELAEVWMCINKKLKPIDCVDEPHPHRATAARLPGAASGPAASLKAAATNWNCRDVIIPKLRDDALQAQGTEPEALTAVQQEGVDSAVAEEYQIEADLESHVAAAVSSDSTLAGAVERHVAQLVALDAEQQLQEVQQQSEASLQNGGVTALV